MGPNTWRDEQEWPLARTQYTPVVSACRTAASTPERPGAGSDLTHSPTIRTIPPRLSVVACSAPGR